MLLPFPDFGDCAACGVYFEFEGSAAVVELGELRRCGSEEEHAAVADGAAGAEVAYACAGPGDGVAVLRHVHSLAGAVDGAVGADDGGVGSHAGDGNAEDLAGVFE